jgi:hypothetical protein
MKKYMTYVALLSAALSAPAVAATAHHLYISIDSGSVHEIRRFPLASGKVTHRVDLTYVGVSSPLAIAPSGKLYASTGSPGSGISGSVSAFAPNTTKPAATIVLPVPTEYPLSGLAAFATALAIDAKGYLYVGYATAPPVECADSGIYMFAPGARGNAKPVAQIEMSGADVYALSFDPKGRLVVGVGPLIHGGDCAGGVGDALVTVADPLHAATPLQSLYGMTFGPYEPEFGFERGTDICGFGATVDASGRAITLAEPACFAQGLGATVAVYEPYASGFAGPQSSIVLTGPATPAGGAMQLAADGDDVFVPLSGAMYKDIELSAAFEYDISNGLSQTPLDVIGFPEHGSLAVSGVAVGP